MKIALAQMLPEENALEANLELGKKACIEAKEKFDPDLVLFPEMWSIGFAKCPVGENGMREWEALAITKKHEFYQGFVELAKSLSLNIAITYLEAVDGEKPKNSVSIINPKGETILDYSKTQICNFGFEELEKESPDIDELGCDFNCSAGKTYDVCSIETSLGHVKVGAMICADREFPEVSTKLFNNGAEIIVVPNSCNFCPLRGAQLRSRAFEILGGVALVNHPSPRNNGNSCAYDCLIWNEDGSYRDNTVIKAGSSEGLYLAEFDLEAIRRFRHEEEWRMKHKVKQHEQK